MISRVKMKEILVLRLEISLKLLVEMKNGGKEGNENKKQKKKTTKKKKQKQ